LLANAYYNITHYGNARLFYQTDITGYESYRANAISKIFQDRFTAQDIAEKCYLQAKSYAQTKEQLARCTFMAGKCERNEYYNDRYREEKEYSSEEYVFPGGKYFAELKQKFADTQYYKEVLRECGYFREYLKSN
jgi:hypothetical protein